MEEDHVHLYISIPVSKPIPYVVQRLKGITSREMRIRFKEELKKYYGDSKSSRAKGYFVASVGEFTDDIVKKYIEDQGKEDVLGEVVEF